MRNADFAAYDMRILHERIPRDRGDLVTVTDLRVPGRFAPRVLHTLLAKACGGQEFTARCRQIRPDRGKGRESDGVRWSSPPVDLSPQGVRGGASSDALQADAGDASAIDAPNLARSGGGF